MRKRRGRAAAARGAGALGEKLEELEVAAEGEDVRAHIELHHLLRHLPQEVPWGAR